MQLSVIIVSYNVRFFLEQCLFAVRKAVVGIDAEVFVVDNHSTDHSIAYLSPLFREVTFISNNQNLGFAKANNQALSRCRGKFVLFLNPDTLIPEDCLQKCLGYMDGLPDTGALGVRMLDGKGKFLAESKRSFPSPMASLFKLTGLSAVFPRSGFFNRYALGHLDELRNHEVDVLAGAFFLSRKTLLDELGGFDGNFFLYGEDIDLSYRIQQKGWKNRYFAETCIIHFKGESSSRASFNHTRFFYQAMLVFVRKHYKTGAAARFAFFIKTAVILRSFFAFAARLLKPVSLPLLDLLLVWSALQCMRYGWIQMSRQGLDFNLSFVPYALPLFSLVFVSAAAVVGLYDKLFAVSRILLASAFGILCMLALYSLLPETIRFSRGVILGGGILGAVLVILLRLSFFKQLQRWMGYQKEHPGQVLIIADKKADAEVRSILENTYPEEQLINIPPGETPEDHSMIRPYLQQQPAAINEIIFCEGDITVAQLIQHTQQLSGSGVRLLFHMTGSQSIVGSDLRSSPGRSFSRFTEYRITQPYQRRMKRIVDIFFSLWLLFAVPVCLLLFYKKGKILWRRSLLVLQGTYSWVGYSWHQQAHLPLLKPGIVSQAGRSRLLLSDDMAAKLDTLYVKNYDWWQDVIIIARNITRLA